MTLAHPDGRPIRLAHVTNSTAARASADRIDAALAPAPDDSATGDPGGGDGTGQLPSLRFDGPAKEGLPAAWESNADVVVSYLALGATVRIVAPLLGTKAEDPGLVVVNEGGSVVVPVLGGHAQSANRVAEAIAEVLGGAAAVTTATDSTGLPALDTLGWPFAGDMAGVTRSILEDRPVDLRNDVDWPLPEFPENVHAEAADPAGRVVVTDADPAAVLAAAEVPTVVLTPPSLAVGMGCKRDTPLANLRTHLTDVLAANGLAVGAVATLTSVDAKADEPGLQALAAELGVPLCTYPAELLDTQNVPTPSDAPAKAVGTHSVSEASVLADGAELLVTKQKAAASTVAIGRARPRGRLAVIGLGAGAPDLITPRARDRILSADAVVGYTVYIDQVRDMLRPGVHVVSSGMGTEQSRAVTALALAREGRTVALVCSGDPAIYAMASPTLQVAEEEVAGDAASVPIEVVPGVTASLASSAILGASLGHDHVTLSLSDLHTSWEAIERRARAAAEGDFVTVLYNPRSRTRTWQLPTVLDIMREHRPPTTPVAVVENATRPDERVVTGTLADFDVEEVNMFGLVVIGSSTTYYADLGPATDRVMITPRDYQWMERPEATRPHGTENTEEKNNA